MISKLFDLAKWEPLPEEYPAPLPATLTAYESNSAEHWMAFHEAHRHIRAVRIIVLRPNWRQRELTAGPSCRCDYRLHHNEPSPIHGPFVLADQAASKRLHDCWWRWSFDVTPTCPHHGDSCETSNESGDRVTPADELKLAADKLDALASGATDGPWIVERSEDFLGQQVSYCLLGMERWRGLTNDVQFGEDEETARYVAAVNPLVGKALAEWLREAARHASEQRGWDAEAVTLARLINGTSEQRPDDDPAPARSCSGQYCGGLGHE